MLSVVKIMLVEVSCFVVGRSWCYANIMSTTITYMPSRQNHQKDSLKECV